MTQVQCLPGLLYPNQPDPPANGVSASGVLDATGEKIAFIGKLYINGKPAGTKTLSTGTIKFRAASVTFNNAGTTLDVGIQDVSTTAGPIAQPDGTFDVKATLTGGGGGLVNNINTVTMNSGSKAMAHGDLFAIVFDMTAKAGVDTAVITTVAGSMLAAGNNQMPITNAFIAAAWQAVGSSANGAGRMPLALITFNDGTLGWFDTVIPYLNSTVAETFTDATNPDERGLLFQVPWDCKTDAAWISISIAGATSDFQITLYSDPLGTPVALAGPVAILAENLGTNLSGGGNQPKFAMFQLGSDVTLTKNTDYMLAVKATGAGSIVLGASGYESASHRVAENNGTNTKKATRNNSTGAFTAESPALTSYNMGIRLISFDDGMGAGGAHFSGFIG